MIEAWLSAPLEGEEEDVAEREDLRGRKDGEGATTDVFERDSTNKSTGPGALNSGQQDVPYFVVVVLGIAENTATEFPCLAVEASTGRQRGRFHRWVTPQSKAQEALPVAGIRNARSTAIPLPQLLVDLQMWMEDLGLRPTYEGRGTGEEGKPNFRWVVCGDQRMKEHIFAGLCHLRESIPTHFYEWSDLIRVFSREANRPGFSSWARGQLSVSQSSVMGQPATLTCPPLTLLESKQDVARLAQFLGLQAPLSSTQGPGTLACESVSWLARCLRLFLSAGIPIVVTAGIRKVSRKDGHLYRIKYWKDKKLQPGERKK
ncbi:unnamed protein product, partial [Discosporangium mesarthrocarpum]